MSPGTTDELFAIGVRGPGKTGGKLTSLTTVKKGWMETNAFFKPEPGQISVGLGFGDALDIFNRNIDGFEVVKFISFK